MDLKQARKILEVNENSTPDEIKKQFRKLSAIYHPDVKETGSEAKFKELNEAKQLIDKLNNKEPQEFNIADLFGRGPIGNAVQDFIHWIKPPPPIELNLSLTFEESILGCSKVIEYQRNKACETCKGQGRLPTTACTKCQGKGQTKGKRKIWISFSEKEVDVWMQCTECEGSGANMIECSKCQGNAESLNQEKLSVKIRPGIQNGNILRLPQMGNYSPQTEEYLDVVVKVTVIPHQQLSLSDNGKDVLFKTSISLLEALKGTKIKVPTVIGEEEVEIPAKFKNAQKVKIAGKGVVGQGDQIIELEVNYPDNIDQIIKILEPTEILENKE